MAGLEFLLDKQMNVLRQILNKLPVPAGQATSYGGAVIPGGGSSPQGDVEILRSIKEVLVSIDRKTKRAGETAPDRDERKREEEKTKPFHDTKNIKQQLFEGLLGRFMPSQGKVGEPETPEREMSNRGLPGILSDFWKLREAKTREGVPEHLQKHLPAQEPPGEPPPHGKTKEKLDDSLWLDKYEELEAETHKHKRKSAERKKAEKALAKHLAEKPKKPPHDDLEDLSGGRPEEPEEDTPRRKPSKKKKPKKGTPKKSPHEEIEDALDPWMDKYEELRAKRDEAKPKSAERRKAEEVIRKHLEEKPKKPPHDEVAEKLDEPEKKKFKYEGVGATGAPVQEEIEARSADEAHKKARRAGHFITSEPTEVVEPPKKDEPPDKKKGTSFWNKWFGGGGKPPGKPPEEDPEKLAETAMDIPRAMEGDPAAIADLAKKAEAETKRRGRELKAAGSESVEMLESQRVGGLGSHFGRAVQHAGKAAGGTVGKVTEGIGKVVEALSDSIEHLRRWNEMLHEGNMRFAEFSGSMAAVQARQELRDIQLQMERGERRAKSAEMLAQSRQALEKAAAPLEDAWNDVVSHIMVYPNYWAASPLRFLGGMLGASGSAQDEGGNLGNVADWASEAGKGTWEKNYGKGKRFGEY